MTEQEDKRRNTTAQVVALARGAKQHLAEAGEGDGVSDAVLLRAAVAYAMLERTRPLIDKNYKPLDDFGISCEIAVIALNFADDPPNTPQRLALFAMDLSGTPEVLHG